MQTRIRRLTQVKNINQIRAWIVIFAFMQSPNSQTLNKMWFNVIRPTNTMSINIFQNLLHILTDRGVLEASIYIRGKKREYRLTKLTITDIVPKLNGLEDVTLARSPINRK